MRKMSSCALVKFIIKNRVFQPLSLNFFLIIESKSHFQSNKESAAEYTTDQNLKTTLEHPQTLHKEIYVDSINLSMIYYFIKKSSISLL